MNMQTEAPSQCTIEKEHYQPRDNRHNGKDPAGFGPFGRSIVDGFRMRQDDEYVDTRPMDEVAGLHIVEGLCA